MYLLKYGKKGIKDKYVRKLKNSIQCLRLITAEKEIIFCKNRFINSNKALRPIDLLWERGSCELELCRDSPASVSVCLHPLVLSHGHTPHLPLNNWEILCKHFIFLIVFNISQNKSM